MEPNIKYLDWDSEFWDMNLAEVIPKKITESDMLEVEKFIVDQGIDMTRYLCDCHDSGSIKLAEDYGYHFVDMILTFSIKPQPFYNPIGSRYKFRIAEEKDIPMLRCIASDAYKDSKYFFDKNFPEEKAQEFYKNWVEKAVHSKYDHTCYCVFENELPVAYCTLRFDGPTARIGLFGVDSNYQNMGVGSSFMQKILHMLWAMKIQTLYVGTQGRNYVAQRFYQRNGFLTHSTEIWYHKWI